MPKGKDEVGLGQGGRAKQEDFADRGCKACPSIGVGFESGDPVISSDTQLLLWSCRSSSPKAETQRDELGSKAAKLSTEAAPTSQSPRPPLVNVFVCSSLVHST